ncbi:EAL domain-containing response regulator [Chitinimonas sp. PSY-7]|uniref:EAL domain-containing protein n=1 Tax=Chitinimonas sp. PSY-7 TaxID=3459088 RepID=UPI0040400662
MSKELLWEGRHVLVVEDSPVQREVAVALLKQFGFATISCAGNGREALWTMERVSPIDLLITDIDMPEMDGIQLIETLGRKGYKQFSLVVITGKGIAIMEAVATIALSIDLDVLGAIEKPMSIPMLQRVLAKGPRRKVKTVAAVPTMSVADIRAGLAAGQIVPWFQPKVAAKTGDMEAVEALARWVHPEYGVLSPAVFICQIEESELSEPFFFHILEQTARHLQDWQQKGSELIAAINLPVPLLMNPKLPDMTLDIIRRYNIPPSRVTLEVTESMLMSNLALSLGTLARLRLKGFLLSMDDYGTGYSSPQQLMRCPFTELKIDRGFVHGAAHKTNLKVILTSALDMAQQLHLKSVVEGVEDLEDWQLVSELGVGLVQGYFVAKAMPGDQLLEWYAAYRRDFKPANGAM